MFNNTSTYFQFPEGYTPQLKFETKKKPDVYINKPPSKDIIQDKQKDDTKINTEPDVVKKAPAPPKFNTATNTIKEVGSAASEAALTAKVDGILDLLKFGREVIKPPKFAGERHAVLKMPDGSYTTGNFIGPGTAVNERLKAGGELAKPVSEVDRIAKKHDLAYYKASNNDDIRKADNEMLDSVAIAQQKGKDHIFNLSQAKLIAFKTKLEDLGVSPTRFTSFGGFDQMTEDNKDRQERALAELIQEGYGTKWDDKDVDKFKKEQYPKPGERLYKKLSGAGKKKKRSKIPKKMRMRILRNMELEEALEDTRIPNNVRDALNTM